MENPYSLGSYTFTPAIAIDSSEQANVYMTDDNGVVKHWTGTTLVTDSDQTVKKHGSATVAVTSDVAASAGATIAQVYDALGAQTGYHYCIVTISSSDARVKLRKDAPTVSNGGYADQSIDGVSNNASKGIKFSVDLTSVESTTVISATNFYWAYDGNQATDGAANADTTIAQITLTATVTFSDTNPNA